MSEAEEIARFIAERGVTRCPPGFAAASQASDPAAELPLARKGQRWRRRWYGRDLRVASLPAKS